MTMAHDIARLADLARSHDLRIAVVESLTSGRLAHTIGAGEAASGWFAGGLVAYMTDVKQYLLNLKPGVDPCSAECAEQLASGGVEMFAADVCVATTGIGGPAPEHGHVPGTVYLGWATHHSVGHVRLQADGGPDAVLATTVTTAMRLLRVRAEEFVQTSDHAVHDP